MDLAIWNRLFPRMVRLWQEISSWQKQLQGRAVLTKKELRTLYGVLPRRAFHQSRQKDDGGVFHGTRPKPRLSEVRRLREAGIAQEETGP